MIKRVSIAAAVALGLHAATAQAVPLAVANPSFEFPDVVQSGLPALPFEFVPLLFGPSADVGWDVSGLAVQLDPSFPAVVPIVLFPNVPANHPDAPLARITNLDGNQAASLFALTGTTMSQLLGNPFAIGQTYALTAALGKSVLSPPVAGSSIRMEFFFVNDQLQEVLVGSLTVLESDLAGTLMADKTLTLPPVAAGDAWAGREIGIRFVTDSGRAVPGGFLSVDNVRVNSGTTAAIVPEPATLGLLLTALAATGVRRRRLA
jgi:hypothetical protein